MSACIPVKGKMRQMCNTAEEKVEIQKRLLSRLLYHHIKSSSSKKNTVMVEKVRKFSPQNQQLTTSRESYTQNLSRYSDHTLSQGNQCLELCQRTGSLGQPRALPPQGLWGHRRRPGSAPCGAPGQRRAVTPAPLTPRLLLGPRPAV